MKRLSLILVFVCAFFLNFDLFAQYSGGAGTSGSPYQISTKADINSLMTNTTDWSKYFVLTQNLDFSTPPTWGSGNPGPIGNSSTSFTGHFDGQGYTISNLNINKSTDIGIGFFGASSGTISNLSLYNVNITGQRVVGGFCAGNDGLIQNCTYRGNVSGEEIVGGFCGFNMGTIRDCSASGSASSSSYTTYGTAGGFCAFNGWFSTPGSTTFSGTIQNCRANTNTSGIQNIGGFCGANVSGSIQQSQSTGSSSGTMSVGGFCGSLFMGTLSENYSTGSVTGAMFSGGFVGVAGFFATSAWTIEKCFSSGNVNCTTGCGGFIGVGTQGLVENCYSLGDAAGSGGIGGFCGGSAMSVSIQNCYSMGQASGSTTVGGFIGSDDNSSSISCCFWLKPNGSTLDDIGDLSGSPNDHSDIFDKTTAEFARQSTFNCFSFGDIWTMRPDRPELLALYPILAIPTFTEWAIIVSIGLFLLFGVWFVRRLF